MKGSLIILAFFAAGIMAGYFGVLPAEVDWSGIAEVMVYVLVGFVGFEFGHKSLVATLRKMTPGAFLLPLFTVAGTLLFTALAWMVIGGYSLSELLAVGSGLGYYSLSSVLIVGSKKAAAGIDVAAQLGTLALLTNIMREMLAMTGAGVIRRVFGGYAPVAAAGVTSMDVALPVVVRVCGNEAMPLAIVHGVFLEVAVPVLVLFFCSL